MVLRREIYASAALLGAIVVGIGTNLHLPSFLTGTVGAALCLALRLTALRRGWQLPVRTEVDTKPDSSG